MIVMLCVDTHAGMMFHGRRQSKDRVLLKRVQAICSGKKLYMNAYSFKMFEAAGINNIIVDPAFMEQADIGAYCYVENCSLKAYEEKIEKIILFQWNRRYPADLYLDISLKERWKLEATESFRGSSHEKITQEVYTR